jgi:uncharacterized protein YdeI (YjbR/CyaY-like superfamily)
MPQTDPRIDAYIAAAQPFARPILEHFRSLVHRALPDADETLKWSMPHWTVGGKNVAGMAAFKAHCAFMIHGDGRQGGDEGMGHLGKVASLTDLPCDQELTARLHEARERVRTRGTAVKKAAAPRATKAEIAMPDDFAAALQAAPAAKTALDGFAPSHRREYLEWIVEAKRPETRAKRIVQAVEWLADGKKRNWKYEGC